MRVTAGETYDFAAQVRNVAGNSKVEVQLVGTDGTTLASAVLGGFRRGGRK